MKGFCTLCILWCEDRSCVDYFFLELYVSSIILYVIWDCEPKSDLSIVQPGAVFRSRIFSLTRQMMTNLYRLGKAILSLVVVANSVRPHLKRVIGRTPLWKTGSGVIGVLNCGCRSQSFTSVIFSRVLLKPKPIRWGSCTYALPLYRSAAARLPAAYPRSPELRQQLPSTVSDRRGRERVQYDI